MPGYSNSRRSFGRGSTGAYRPGRSFKPSRRGPSKQFIDPAKFVQAAKSVQAEVFVPKHKFADFKVDDLLKRNIIAKGYITPSKIQDEAIPYGLEGRDVVGIANTGTGKTAAFALPLLQKMITDSTARALVIAPTRELAAQIEAEFRSLSKGSRVRTVLLIGGTAMYPQVRGLRDRPQLVIGTPGRIKDHVMQNNLKLQYFQNVVLDEVDRMVDMGFIQDIRFLLGELGEPRQSLFFSATMDSKIESLVHSFLTNPVTVSVKTGITADNVEQEVIRHGDNADKIQKLHDVLRQSKDQKVLIFDETKRSVEKLSKDLVTQGFNADALHGGKSQGQRTRALNKFRHNEINILVATDVAARGIDVADITHVINFTTPQTYDDYIHRIGRAGRAGRSGNALTFISK